MGGFFYQKGKSESLQQSLVILSSDYGQLHDVKTELQEILSSNAKGDQIKNSLYLLRKVEIANASLLNISTLVANDERDFNVITNEVSLAAADISSYIHQHSLGFDTKKIEEKLQKHGDALLLITETLTPKDIRAMDQDRIRYKLSLLQNSLPH